MFDYDKSSKWLISHHGGALLRLAGWNDVTSWRALPAEVAQPRRFPDGILEVKRAGRSAEGLVGIEIATYADARVAEQVLRSLLLIYSDKGVLPDMLVLVLHPRGNVDVPDRIELTLPGSRTRLAASWQVVKLWELPAEALLSSGDVGCVPWVPLADFEGPVEPLLRRCRDRIERDAAAGEKANLLAVSQVLTKLRFPDGGLLQVFGGSQAMIESPLIDEIVHESMLKANRSMLLDTLARRLGPPPEDVAATVAGIRDRAVFVDCLSVAPRFADWGDVRTWYRDHVVPGGQ